MAPNPMPAACVAVAALLAGCGGGAEAELDQPLASGTAQGYAADAQAMPLAATTTLQVATQAIERALRVAGAVPAPGQSSVTVNCGNGGRVTFGISGGSAAQRLNGWFDAGETYSVTFDQCGGPAPDGGGVLDGSLALTVGAYSATEADLTHRADNLRLTGTQGRYTLNGAVREQRSSTGTGGGGVRLASRLTSSGLSLQTLVGGRSGSYELRSIDWTVVSTLDAAGLLLLRTHQGTLSLAVGTPRRPQATLQVATEGSLIASGNGLYAAQGSFSLATHRDRVAVTYGGTTVTLELDLGNDGSVDRRWALPRTGFDGEAG